MKLIPTTTILKILTVLVTVSWPLTAKAAYFELAGGAVAIGSSYRNEDSRLLWTAIIRMALTILAIFVILRLVGDSYALKMTHNTDTEHKTIDSMTNAGKILVVAIVAATMAPYAVDIFFNFMAGAYQLDINFG